MKNIFKVLVVLEEISEICWPNPCYLWLLGQDTLQTDRFLRFADAVCIHEEYVYVNNA